MLEKLLAFVTKACTTSSGLLGNYSARTKSPEPRQLSSAPATWRRTKPQNPIESLVLARRGEWISVRGEGSGFPCADGAGVPQAVRCLLRHQRDEGMVVCFFPEIFVSLFG